jgi:hypothetical protein
MRFFFGISTPPICAHWMTRLLKHEPYCLIKPITLQLKLKESAPQSNNDEF